MHFHFYCRHTLEDQHISKGSKEKSEAETEIERVRAERQTDKWTYKDFDLYKKNKK